MRRTAEVDDVEVGGRARYAEDSTPGFGAFLAIRTQCEDGSGEHMSSEERDPGIRRTLWRFAPMIYGPTILFSLGEGALLPLLPVLTERAGGDLAQAAAIASIIVVAQLIGNVPAGWAVSRIGERWTMAIAATIALIGCVGVALAPHLGVLAISVFGIGLCASAFGLARHAFMTSRVPMHYRARALSLLGGSFRFGMFLGPFAAAALLALTGDPTTTAWFFAACLVALIVLVTLGRDPEEQLRAEGITPRQSRGALSAAAVRDDILDDSGEATTGAIPLPQRVGVFRTAWRNRAVLSRLGVTAAMMSAVRQARIYVLPLWAVSLGLGPESITLIVGIAGGLEFLLFYASGQIMDRWGRLLVTLPPMLIMGGAFFALAFTHDLPDAVPAFVIAAVVIGIGNGLSSGSLMTLGADAAPPDDPAPFLGAWRTLTDAGGASAPLLVTAVTAVSTLSVAVGLIGVIGLIGALGFARYVPRFSPRPR